jgi:hypothetical protein
MFTLFATIIRKIAMRLLALAITLTFPAIANQANQNSLGSPQNLIESSQTIGTGKFTYFGLNIYQAKYMSLENSIKNSFALELKYARNFSGESIASETIKQMKKIGVTNPAIARWENDLKGIFPNIENGHTLTGIYIPQKGTTFLHNGNKVGEIAGDEFSKAFFGIWLDEKTSAPELRTQLLSEKCSPKLIDISCR